MLKLSDILSVSATGESSQSFAAPQVSATTAPVSGLANALEMLIALALVLAAIFALAWLLRRLRMMPMGRQSLLRAEAELQLGEKERVILLAMGDSRWLLGVTTSSFTVLHHYESVAAMPVQANRNAETGAQSKVGNFAAVLRSSLGIAK